MSFSYCCTLISLLSCAPISFALNIPQRSTSLAAENASFLELDLDSLPEDGKITDPEIICNAAEVGYGGNDLDLARYVFQIS